MKRLFLLFCLFFYSSVACSAAYELKVIKTPGYYDTVSVESWDINDPRPNPMKTFSGWGGGLKLMIFIFTITIDLVIGIILMRLPFLAPGMQKLWGI